MTNHTDKKFRALQRDWERKCIHTAFAGRGQHLVQRVRRGIRFVVRTDNARRQAPYLPASPIVNGVRMRWEDGKLVPRHANRHID